MDMEVLQIIAKTRMEINAIRAKYATMKAGRTPADLEPQGTRAAVMPSLTQSLNSSMQALRLEPHSIESPSCTSSIHKEQHIKQRCIYIFGCMNSRT